MAGMKIAISGKGGVGKTTVAALLARAVSRRGNRVIAIDADPDANLAASLGYAAPDSIRPLISHKDIINERVGTGGVIRLNPRVDDLLDTIAVDIDGIRLMVLGTIPRGGGGCFCSPSALLKALMLHVLAQPDEWVILDMEAGLEHLGRGSSGGIDGLIIVVEPSQRSIETARRIKALAGDIGITRIWVVANKTESESDVSFIRDALSPLPLLGAVPRSPSLEGFGARVDNASVAPPVIESMESILRSMQFP
jgi:CO dehydrogenase maturation factor